MTDFNDSHPPPPASGAIRHTGVFRHPRGIVLGGLMIGAVALGVGGLALAEGMDHGGWDRGVRMAFLQRGVARALDSVGASSSQEAAVHDIIAAKLVELAPDPKERDALRKQALDLLGAPAIDRVAVEKLRADIVARFDAKSKLFVEGLLQIADQLKPEQRAELTTRLAAMPPGGGPMGFGGPHRRHERGGDDDGPDRD